MLLCSLQSGSCSWPRPQEASTSGAEAKLRCSHPLLSSCSQIRVQCRLEAKMITSIFQLMDFIIKRVRQCCDVNEIYKSFSMNLKPFFFFKPAFCHFTLTCCRQSDIRMCLTVFIINKEEGGIKSKRKANKPEGTFHMLHCPPFDSSINLK